MYINYRRLIISLIFTTIISMSNHYLFGQTDPIFQDIEDRNFAKLIPYATERIKLENTAIWYQVRAMAYKELNKNDLALLDINKAIELDSLIPDYYILKSKLNYRLINPESALQVIEQGILNCTNDYTLYQQMSTIHYNIGKDNKDKNEIHKAESIINQLIKDSASVSSYLIRSAIYEYKKEKEKAIEDYNSAIIINPTDDDLYLQKGNLLMRLEMYAKAILEFSNSLRINPNNEISYYRRGLSKFNLKDYDGAIIDFNFAINLENNWGMYYYYRAKAYFKIKQNDAACSDLSKAAELDGDVNLYKKLRKKCN